MAVPNHSEDPWTRVRTLHDFPADEVISGSDPRLEGPINPDELDEGEIVQEEEV